MNTLPCYLAPITNPNHKEIPLRTDFTILLAIVAACALTVLL